MSPTRCASYAAHSASNSRNSGSVWRGRVRPDIDCALRDAARPVDSEIVLAFRPVPLVNGRKEKNDGTAVL
jgi:hypothetical protein